MKIKSSIYSVIFKTIISLVIIIVVGCTPKTYTRSPEVLLKIVDEQQQPVVGASVLTSSIKDEQISEEAGIVILPADAETKWTPLFIPGGAYPVYNDFLITDNRYKAMSCSCMTMNFSPDCPPTEIILYTTDEDQSDIREKLIKMFKEKGQAISSIYDRTTKVQFGERVECQVYE